MLLLKIDRKLNHYDQIAGSRASLKSKAMLSPGNNDS